MRSGSVSWLEIATLKHARFRKRNACPTGKSHARNFGSSSDMTPLAGSITASYTTQSPILSICSPLLSPLLSPALWPGLPRAPCVPRLVFPNGPPDSRPPSTSMASFPVRCPFAEANELTYILVIADRSAAQSGPSRSINPPRGWSQISSELGDYPIIFFIDVVIVIISVCALATTLWEPHRFGADSPGSTPKSPPMLFPGPTHTHTHPINPVLVPIGYSLTRRSPKSTHEYNPSEIPRISLAYLFAYPTSSPPPPSPSTSLSLSRPFPSLPFPSRPFPSLRSLPPSLPS